METWMIETARRVVVVLLVMAIVSLLVLAATSIIGEGALVLPILYGIAAAAYLIEPHQRDIRRDDQ